MDFLKSNDSLDNLTALTNKQTQNLAVVYILSLSFSIIGSISVISVSLVKKKYFDDQVRPLVQLTLADFLAAALLFSTTVIELLPAEGFLNAYVFCHYGMGLALSFYCVSFLLVMIYAYEVKLTVQGWRETSNPNLQNGTHCKIKREHLYLLYFLAWSVPVVAFIVNVITILNSATEIIPNHLNEKFALGINKMSVNEDYSFFCSRCIFLIHMPSDICEAHEDIWKRDLVMKILFFLYVFAVVTCSVVAYCKVNLWCRRYEEDGLFCLRGDGFNNRNIKDIYLTVKFIFLAFLICWTPAFILIILSLANISPTKLFALYIIQAFTMSLQGFLDSIAYGWLRRNFRQVALGERSPILLASNARPFYDESLTLPRS
ncbi:transmembrane protein 116 [Polypterus senegalus]|uniref:transmembrane protein 116 n=1 Tax=Polypterus senegalus TaxID=55291 RepID=UPI0019624369|nr:transmembrane protein 116 [Polypterus senegalus]